MNLVIVESPTKARTIKRFLGRGYTVKSSYGHIRDLPRKKLGVDVKHDFKPQYVIPDEAQEVVEELKKAAQKADLIILATDEDREGEAIAWHITEILDSRSSKDYQRIVFHEITKKAMEQALKNPRRINIYLVNAQQARRILDRLVGYELSPFLWHKVARGLSAGRVQSVAVKLIVDREREIENFKPEEYWSIEAELTRMLRESDSDKNTNKDSNIFRARLVKKNNKTIPKLGIKTKEEADKILKDLKGAEYRVKEIIRKETRRYPLPPFTTSTLQQEASRRLHFTAKQTMRIAQQLYEGIALGEKGSTGLITYMRTDSLNLSNESLKAAQAYIKERFGLKYAPPEPRRYKTKSKGAQEAHEAIRPTDPQREPEKIKKYLDQQQYKLYDLVWKRMIASQMEPAIIDSTSVDIKAKNYIFRATGAILKFDGFLRVYPLKITEAILPPLVKNELLKLLKLIPEQHFTQPPPRYTEATLVKALEENGIGRPSTYAPIISTIQERQYVEKDAQRRFHPQEIGIIVNDLLVEHFPGIVNVKFTAEVEKNLDKIAQGKEKWVPVVHNFYTPFKEKLLKKEKEVAKKKLEEKTEEKCPQCGKPLVIKMGRYGKFLACSGFPQCKYTKNIEKTTGVRCPECKKGEIIEKRSKKGKIFYSCNRYPKCKYALWNKPTGEKCPQCGSLLVTTPRGKVRCSNRECSYKTTDILE